MTVSNKFKKQNYVLLRAWQGMNFTIRMSLPRNTFSIDSMISFRITLEILFTDKSTTLIYQITSKIFYASLFYCSIKMSYSM